MRILKTMLALALCLALAVPCAVAQPSGYVPGETMNRIFSKVFHSGKMINADLSMILQADGTPLGLSDEDQAQMDAFSLLLEETTLRVGVCRLPDGLRIEMTGMLDAQEGAQDVQARMAFDLTRTGLSIDSSLFEGRKITMTWETFLELCEVDDQTIATIMSLLRGETSFEALLNELLAQIEPMVTMAAQMLEPYGRTIEAWIRTLNVEQLTNVAATENYPAAATVTNVYVTDKDLGALITQLCGQLKADQTACALLDAILTELNDGDPLSTVELCDELIKEAATLTDTQNPLVVTVAQDAYGTPLYFELFNLEANGQSEYMGAFLYPQADNPNAYNYDLSVYALSSSGNVQGGFSFYGTMTVDPQDPLATDLVMNFACVEDGETLMGMEYTISSASKPTADGLSGYVTDLAMTMSVNDGGDTVQMLFSGNTQSGLTKQGGEQTDVTMSFDVYANGEGQQFLTALGGMIVEPCESGLTGSYSIIESIPEGGLERFGFQMLFSSEDYAPAALQEIAMETVSEQEFSALVDEIMASVNALASQAKQAIPADALELFMEIAE